MIERPPNHVRKTITRVRGDQFIEAEDVVAAEEPLEIRLVWDNGGAAPVRKSIAITMRTPGDDFELATGFLYGEGIVRGREDIIDVSYCLDEDESQALNIVSVTLSPGLDFDVERLERHFYTTSSCGVCGKAALESLEVQGCEPLSLDWQVSAGLLCRLPAALREAQLVFEKTGGLHASGLFDRQGSLLGLKEDVGRHNALDKLVGERLLEGAMPLSDCLLMLSGRASFELVQKALVARIPVVASVGAPSSLAVELADSFGMTLAGFVRDDGFNVYCGAERLATNGGSLL